MIRRLIKAILATHEKVVSIEALMLKRETTLATLNIEIAYLRQDIAYLRAAQSKVALAKAASEPTPEELAKRHGLPPSYADQVDWERMA